MSGVMKKGCAKHIVYRYDDETSEVEFDRSGELAFTTGDIISRHRTSWKIESIEQEMSTDNLMRLPTYWIYLTHVVVN